MTQNFYMIVCSKFRAQLYFFTSTIRSDEVKGEQWQLVIASHDKVMV